MLRHLLLSFAMMTVLFAWSVLINGRIGVTATGIRFGGRTIELADVREGVGAHLTAPFPAADQRKRRVIPGMIADGVSALRYSPDDRPGITRRRAVSKRANAVRSSAMTAALSLASGVSTPKLCVARGATATSATAASSN